MKGTRRDFFGQSAKLIATGIIGSSIIDKVARAAEPVKKTDTPTSKPSPVELRTLGRTGLKISVISCGSIGTSENVVRYSLDHGINFIHTSYDYSGGKSIREVGKALKGKNKNKAILGLKVVWNWSQDEILNRSLKLMGREYVDIIFFPIENNPARVASPEAKAAFDRWKKQGKVRFMGLTSHGGMKECMQSALDVGWYDCLMPTYTLDMRDNYQDIFKQCEKKNIGLIAMKTGISEANTSPIPAMLRDKPLTTICKSLKDLDSVKKYLEAAKQQVTDAEFDRTMELAKVWATGRCAMCGVCTGNCPNGLAVNDLVRSVNYYVDNARDFEAGKEVYAEIEPGKNADACRDCGACEKACPNRVPVRHFIRRSKELFA